MKPITQFEYRQSILNKHVRKCCGTVRQKEVEQFDKICGYKAKGA